jgi:hypothetical protein
MGWYVAACWPLLIAIVVASYEFRARKKAVRYAVTLVRNEGAFIGLCIQKRWNTWTFVDVKIQPTNPGGAQIAAAPGELHVPSSNILYYQEITNVAE